MGGKSENFVRTLSAYLADLEIFQIELEIGTWHKEAAF